MPPWREEEGGREDRVGGQTTDDVGRWKPKDETHLGAHVIGNTHEDGSGRHAADGASARDWFQSPGNMAPSDPTNGAAAIVPDLACKRMVAFRGKVEVGLGPSPVTRARHITSLSDPIGPKAHTPRAPSLL